MVNGRLSLAGFGVTFTSSLDAGVDRCVVRTAFLKEAAERRFGRIVHRQYFSRCGVNKHKSIPILRLADFLDCYFHDQVSCVGCEEARV